MREMNNNGGKRWWEFWKKAPAAEEEKDAAGDGQEMGELSGTEAEKELEGEGKGVNQDLVSAEPAEESKGETGEEASDQAVGEEKSSEPERSDEVPEENPDSQLEGENEGETPEAGQDGESASGEDAAENGGEAEQKEGSEEENSGTERAPELKPDAKAEITEEETGEGAAGAELEASPDVKEDPGAEDREAKSETSPDGKEETGGGAAEGKPEASSDREEDTAENTPEAEEKEENSGESRETEQGEGTSEESGKQTCGTEETETSSEQTSGTEETEASSEQTSGTEETETSSEQTPGIEGTENSSEQSPGTAETETSPEKDSAGGEEPQPADLVKDNGNGLDHDLSAEEREEEEREKADQAAYEARRQIRMARLQRRKRKRKIQKAVCTVMLILLALVAAGAGGIYLGYIKPETVRSVVAAAESTRDVLMEKLSSIHFGKKLSSENKGPDVYDVLISENTGEVDLNKVSPDDGDTAETSGQAVNPEGTPEGGEPPAYQPTTEDLALLEQAERLAAQYSYTDAILLLKNCEHFQQNEDMRAAVREYRKLRKSCVSWPLEEITHVFYHTLIKDTAKAFDGDFSSGNYNQVMTTIDEFNKITQSMYDRGYVMVSLYDMAQVNGDGSVTRGRILLPPGKIPFVLSQDDVSYYHYMDGDGFASRLIVDEEGKIRNEYLEDDGSVSVGDYDVVPLIDRFVEQHPDFSYHGAKGIVALTGYDGILGYRTDISYETRPDDLDDDKRQWLDAHPDFSLETERAGAKKVADAMRREGWLFASHTWGHKNVGEASLERLMTDTELFKENVDPLIGGTDIIVFAFGTDLTTDQEYSGEKFEYFKGQGYNYFCNVDSSRYFVRIGPNYLRMGRRNLDGYRMYYNPELLDDLFDASEVFDPARPTPVPEMG